MMATRAVEMPHGGTRKIMSCPWRLGRSLGFTIYAIVGDEPSKQDIYLGQMDTNALALAVVDLHNTELAA